MGYLYFFHKSLKSIVYFAMIVYLNLVVKFSPETLDMWLEFIKCTVRTIDHISKLFCGCLEVFHELNQVSVFKCK